MKKRGNTINEFVIPFSGLKEARHFFNFKVEKKFFENIPDSLIEDGEVSVDFVLEKKSTMMILEFEIEGSVYAACDRCMDPVKLPIESTQKLYVKFGDENYQETDEIIILEESEYEIDITPFIYEFMVLAVPSKKVHDEGNCNEEYISKLEEYIVIDENNSDDEDDDFDSRWDALKKLK